MAFAIALEVSKLCATERRATWVTAALAVGDEQAPSAETVDTAGVDGRIVRQFLRDDLGRKTTIARRGMPMTIQNKADTLRQKIRDMALDAEGQQWLRDRIGAWTLLLTGRDSEAQRLGVALLQTIDRRHGIPSPDYSVIFPPTTAEHD